MNITSQIAATLQALEVEGKLTPEIVVRAAQDPDSPLHGYFTWDIAEAAAERWLDQARQLIRSVKVEVKTTHFTVNAPAYVRDPEAPAKTQGYVSLSRLRTDDDIAREAIIAEFARASAALSRAQNIAHALDMSEEIDAVRDQVISLVARAKQDDPDSGRA